MKTPFSINKIDKGHLRLLTILCRNYNVSIEDTINNLIREYNEIHAPIFLEEIRNSQSMCCLTPGRTTPKLRLGVNRKYFTSVEDICNALKNQTDESFLNRLLETSKKLSKDEQVKNIEDTINEILRN